jgi:exodeoxyribonuclease-1
VTLKRERLSVANGLEHLNAHDALSDVRATIGLARLIRDRQPRLYDYLYNLRRKQAVLEQITLLEPLVHVSGRFSAARHFLSVVLPLGWHPRNRNALIVCDLQAEPQPLLQERAETLRQRLYTRRDQLAEGELPVPLKLVHVNKCPVLTPLKVLREADIQRLGLDMPLCQARAAALREQRQLWSHKLDEIYREEGFAGSDDPEQQLYDGFLGERDRRLCDEIRGLAPAELARHPSRFDDVRLEELLFRYRARNFPEALSAAEQAQWRRFCQQRLSDDACGAPNTLAQFEAGIEQSMVTATPAQQQLLQQWRDYGLGLRDRYGLAN